MGLVEVLNKLENNSKTVDKSFAYCPATLEDVGLLYSLLKLLPFCSWFNRLITLLLTVIFVIDDLLIQLELKILKTFNHLFNCFRIIVFCELLFL